MPLPWLKFKRRMTICWPINRQRPFMEGKAAVIDCGLFLCTAVGVKQLLPLVQRVTVGHTGNIVGYNAV